MTADVDLRQPLGSPGAVAFGTLVDFARLRVGTPLAEICDMCNTINMGSARHCKCCAHKLPAFYAYQECGEGQARQGRALAFGRKLRTGICGGFAAIGRKIAASGQRAKP